MDKELPESIRRLREHTGRIPASSPEIDRLLDEAIKYQNWLKSLPQEEQDRLMEESIRRIADECSQLTD